MQKHDSRAPRWERLSSTNIAYGSAVLTTVWGVATALAKVPDVAQAGATAIFGGVGVWQLMKSQFEERRKNKKSKES